MSMNILCNNVSFAQHCYGSEQCYGTLNCAGDQFPRVFLSAHVHSILFMIDMTIVWVPLVWLSVEITP